jgi:hypothetical protein
MVHQMWEMCFMHGHKMGGVVPFFVDWNECAPNRTHPRGWKSLLPLRAPGGHKVHELLKDVG